MRTNNETVYNPDQPQGREQSDSPPVRCFATTWLKGDLGFFRVDITIIGPVSEEPEDYFPLGRGQAEAVFKTVTDYIIFLYNKRGAEDPPGPRDRVR